MSKNRSQWEKQEGCEEGKRRLRIKKTDKERGNKKSRITKKKKKKKKQRVEKAEKQEKWRREEKELNQKKTQHFTLPDAFRLLVLPAGEKEHTHQKSQQVSRWRVEGETWTRPDLKHLKSSRG